MMLQQEEQSEDDVMLDKIVGEVKEYNSTVPEGCVS